MSLDLTYQWNIGSGNGIKCSQARSDYLSQYWLKSMLLYVMNKDNYKLLEQIMILMA